MSNQDEINRKVQKASEVQAKYADMLMSRPHVVGVGVGKTTKGGASTDEIGLIVMVDQKLPINELAPDELIPEILDGVPVDVQEMGIFTAQ